MKQLILALIFCALAQFSFGQNKLPSVKIKDLKGKEVNTSSLDNNGKPMLLVFWATWCKPCLKEMKAYAEIYSDWVEETGMKIVAVSIDDAKSSGKVKGMADAQDWEFEILLDVNSDFKRAMNVANPPHLFLLDGEGKVVYQHNGYSEGSENEIYEMIQLLNEGKSIEKH